MARTNFVFSSFKNSVYTVHCEGKDVDIHEIGQDVTNHFLIIFIYAFLHRHSYIYTYIYISILYIGDLEKRFIEQWLFSNIATIGSLLLKAITGGVYTYVTYVFCLKQDFVFLKRY